MTSTVTVDFPIREPRNAQELAELVQDTINQIQEKFGKMSDTILARVDEMGRRIDELERNISHIMSEANAELP